MSPKTGEAHLDRFCEGLVGISLLLDTPGTVMSDSSRELPKDEAGSFRQRWGGTIASVVWFAGGESGELDLLADKDGVCAAARCCERGDCLAGRGAE